jgi:endo-1,3(4)-beta-glucanase
LKLKRLLVIATLISVALAAGCTPGEPEQTAQPAPVFPRQQVEPLVAGIVQQTTTELPAARLAPGLVPPTNRWFSGLVFGKEPQPVFPLPLSFRLTAAGFAFGLPEVTATEKTIAGGFVPAVSVDAGATAALVSDYDAVTVTIEHRGEDGVARGHTRIARGSPFVSYTTEGEGRIRTGLRWRADGDYWTADAGGVTYGLVLSAGTVTEDIVDLPSGARATWFAVPADGEAARLAELAQAPVIGGAVDYTIEQDTVTTRLTYQTEDDTAFAAMPHQQAGLSGTVCDLGSYPSIYGTLQLCAGRSLAWTTPRREATAALDLNRLSEADRSALAEQVGRDAAGLPPFPADTYFGGKALYRTAMLYRLARQVGAAEPTAVLQTRLTEMLDRWTDPRGCETREAFCFVYDAPGRGIVGRTPSFGSEEYNDHHFHYGYFLYAAGVLAADDPDLADRWAPVMDLLAADLASSAGSGMFPDQRTFDAYAGHSWASGTAPFGDGNNQESSSEAVTAWTGLALWAQARGNQALETEAIWLLSSEAASGLAYWTNVDRAQPVYAGYGHSVVTLNWGGKRDYATWFSPEPAAMLGILLIPMGPASTYLAGDPERITANVAEASSGRFDQQFGDYLLMYAALAGEPQRRAALSKAKSLDDKWIDNGNSRSYLLAWLMSLQA